jgi:hypothetical protein
VIPMQHSSVRLEGTLYEAFHENAGNLIELWAKPPKLEPDDPPTVRKLVWRRGDPQPENPQVLEACKKMDVVFPDIEIRHQLHLTTAQALTLYGFVLDCLPRLERRISGDDERISLKSRQELRRKIDHGATIIGQLVSRGIRPL